MRLAVRAERLKAAAVGAPLEPTFLIFSPEPALILARLALMFAYSPGFIYTPIVLVRLSPWLLAPLPWLLRHAYGHKMTSYALHPS